MVQNVSQPSPAPASIPTDSEWDRLPDKARSSDTAKGWRAARIARFRASQIQKGAWVNFAEIADWCAREKQSIVPDETKRSAALDQLADDLLAGIFDDEEGRSRVLYLHPAVTVARMTRDWLKNVREGNYDNAKGRSQYLPRCWISRQMAERWFQERRLADTLPLRFSGRSGLAITDVNEVVPTRASLYANVENEWAEVIQPPRPPGRPLGTSKYDWPTFYKVAEAKLDDEGGIIEGPGSDFSQATLEAYMAKWCLSRWDKEPVESEVRKHVVAAMKLWRAKQRTIEAE